MNERAATGAGACDPLWHVGAGRALFAGPLAHNASHYHSTAVFLAGLYGSFSLSLREGEWLSCRTAAIPAGVPYEFDMAGDPLGVIYVEPNVAGVEALRPLVRNARDVNGALVGTGGEITLLRELYEDGSSKAWVDLALQDLLTFSKKRVDRAIDGRVSRVVELMRERYDDLTPLAQLAGSVRLSASRFQHLFSREVGVPFRRYRAWHRLRAAIREIIEGSNFTTAAHAAGFADQSHFARDFRRTFGAPASGSLARVRRERH